MRYITLSLSAPTLRDDVQRVLAEMPKDPNAAEFLHRGFIDHFTPVQDKD
jgi:hypothetical protein